MRWEERLLALFDDLEQQAEGLALDARDVEVAELGRAEYVQVDLAARLHASTGGTVRLEVAGSGRVAGTLARVGADWCLVVDAPREWLVRLGALTGAHDLSPRAIGEQARSPVTRLGLGSALRGLAETGEPVRVHRVDGSLLRGVLGRVGADFVELRIEAAAPCAGDAWGLVPFAAIAVVSAG